MNLSSIIPPDPWTPKISASAQGKYDRWWDVDGLNTASLAWSITGQMEWEGEGDVERGVGLRRNETNFSGYKQVQVSRTQTVRHNDESVHLVSR